MYGYRIKYGHIKCTAVGGQGRNSVDELLSPCVLKRVEAIIEGVFR